MSPVSITLFLPSLWHLSPLSLCPALSLALISSVSHLTPYLFFSLCLFTPTNSFSLSLFYVFLSNSLSPLSYCPYLFLVSPSLFLSLSLIPLCFSMSLCLYLSIIHLYFSPSLALFPLSYSFCLFPFCLSIPLSTRSLSSLPFPIPCRPPLRCVSYKPDPRSLPTPPRSTVVRASARGAGGRGSIPDRVTPKT